jgi:hypothetical protein
MTTPILPPDKKLTPCDVLAEQRLAIEHSALLTAVARSAGMDHPLHFQATAWGLACYLILIP